ncbi:hypothetical protein X801_09516 [Opisthorchis viverrini]|uniref:Cilia- and flagella-associated protein 58 central coiled coil domain-containing protein n=1 Tax=Opisthorchis viverrini TaxID=6198 RepID=A0A1S8WJR8_OPIVI|nr:hypothetical protein X801_09516 [Opisthorchis viverrini]
MQTDQKKPMIKPAIDDNAFEALEKEYDGVMEELMGNKGLEKFKDEYEKLMRALIKSHDNEKRLMRKCRELKAEIVSNSAKVSQATKLSSEDPGNMANLKKEVEQAWKLVDLAAEKETRARETIDRLKGEIAHLSKLNMDELKYREMQIFENKKRIAEAETKLKQQQNLYEAVRSDRNLYSKNLIEAQEDIAEMKRKLKILSHQVDQLKDDIATKEATLVKENLERQRVDREKEQLTKELQKMKVQSAENRAYIEAQEAEQSKLLKIVAEAEHERLKERKEHEQVISERDVLGSQLVRRNDELALLYEKIRIQQSLLDKGEREYNQRLRELNLLKEEVRKLRREKALLQSTATKIEDLKAEVHRVQRELVRQRTRAKALEEELENPVNVHRWRKLEGSDPSTYEMILKIQTLQKRLISKTEEVVEKELLIQEKEKLYVELKHILARQPGPEVAEQLNIYQTVIKDKTKQIKLV